MNIFEKAVRNKYRFPSRKGNLTIEDLLDLSLQSLDRIGKTIMKDIKEHEDSLLGGKSTNINQDKLDVVKYIIEEKQRGKMVNNSINEFLSTEEEVL